MIHRLLARKFRQPDSFISFNLDGKNYYTREEIASLSGDYNTDVKRQLSFLLHQMPSGSKLDLTNQQLWKAYELIFIAGEVGHQELIIPVMEPLTEEESMKLKSYEGYQTLYLEAEELLLQSLINDDSEEVTLALRKRLRQIRKDWGSKGFKTEIEELQNQYLARGEYSFAYQWGLWRIAAENAWELAAMDEASMYGSFSADFQDLLSNPHDWVQLTFDNQKIAAATQAPHIHHQLSNPAEVKKGVDKIRLRYKRLSITREWFDENVFMAKYWRWVDKYAGGPVSDGNLSGSIPSYSTDIVFIKDVHFRERSNMVIDFIEWVGGGFTELPFINFIDLAQESFYLVGMTCKKTPLSPDPSPTFFTSI